ncbi:MAG: hypothetical protein IKJ77_08660 [Firmicutes bacterium]|nr:hypothetical protein [Bacillota bacterium]
MDKTPSGKLNEMTVEGAIDALHNFEHVRETLDNDYSELMELIEEYKVPHAEMKLEEIVFSCIYLGFAKGMRFQHCAEHFTNPNNDAY